MCVLDATVLCATVLRLTLSCSKLVTFLFALSKEDNRCLSEKKSQQCVLKSLYHPPAVPFGTVQLQKCQMEVLCFVIFLFFPTQQYSVGFSDMEYFFCCHGVPSCCIFYAIPFLENPWWRRSAPQASCLPCRCVAEVRGCQLWCASALSLAASPHFLAVPLVCKLPALILSANMYKM